MLISIFAFIYNKYKYLSVEACFYFLLSIHIFESFDIFYFSNIRLYFWFSSSSYVFFYYF